MVTNNKNKKFVAIIPARSGSKELKNKNVKILLGHPLIAYSIRAVKKSKYISHIFVTTDGKKIAREALKYGAKVIDRPKSLANDVILPDAAVLHAIKTIEKKINFDYVVFLQPTSPLREKKDIDKAIEMFLKKKADSLFSSVELHSTMWKFNENNVTPYDNSFRVVTSRDKLGSNIVDNGSFYITKKNLFKKAKHRLAGKKIISYIMKNWTIFEIDSKKDFQTVEWMMSSKKNRPKQIILI